jgi:quercetin dioxygenase-like cupin family protein
MDLPVEPLRERHRDDRGELAIPLASGEPAAEVVEVIEFADGAVRGGHVHDRCREVLYVWSGALDAELLHPQGDGWRLQRAHVPAGSRMTIPPGVAHRFTAREPSVAVCLLAGGVPAEDRRFPPAEAWSAAA